MEWTFQYPGKHMQFADDTCGQACSAPVGTFVLVAMQLLMAVDLEPREVEQRGKD